MRKKIERRLRRQLGYPPLKETGTLFGRSLRVFEGVLPRKADKDTAWLAALLRHAEVLLDVGANIGQTAVLAFAAGVKRVAVVEAEPGALMMCVENVVTNFPGAAFTPLLCFASASDEGSTDLYRYGHGSANSMFSSHAVTATRKGDVISVPNRSLDSLVETLHLGPDLVKIDIEGAESLALIGASELARRETARFLIEMHGSDELPMEENARRVIDWSRSVEHRVYYLCEHTELTAPEHVAHRGRCHFLIQPQSFEYPDYLRSIPESAPFP